MGDLDSPFMRALDAEMKAAYADNLRDAARSPIFFDADAPPPPPLTRRRRAWLRITRRPRAIKRRVTEAWDVLLHGLPESDW